MAILRRDDGVQFVLQPYRELLHLKNKSLLKKELQHLSENHGNYARIFKKNGGYEAVFARDSGFLLGEAIWQHLGQPNDLLYIESLPGKQQALVVMVHDNMVHLDTLIDYASLTEELAFLQAENTRFAVYVYGDVPVSERPEAGKFNLEEAQIKSFTRLHAPLYNTITMTPTLRLLSTERAIAELNLDKNAYIALVTTAIILILVIIIWRWQASPAVPGQDQNPLLTYQTALQSPAPAAQLNALAAQIIQAYNVPGWIPTKVSFANGSAQFELHTIGSPLTGLLQWAQTNNLEVQLTSNGALLSLATPLPARAAPTAIVNAQPVLAAVVDRLSQVLPGNNIKIGVTTPHGIYQETRVTINLTNTAPQVLTYMGSALAQLPIALSSGTFSLNSGLLSGTIQLSVLGN